MFSLLKTDYFKLPLTNCMEEHLKLRSQSFLCIRYLTYYGTSKQTCFCCCWSQILYLTDPLFFTVVSLHSTPVSTTAQCFVVFVTILHLRTSSVIRDDLEFETWNKTKNIFTMELATNSNFPTPISLQHDVENLWYF